MLDAAGTIPSFRPGFRPGFSPEFCSGFCTAFFPGFCTVSPAVRDLGRVSAVGRTNRRGTKSRTET
ncbi:MAG: hypothetical protein ACYDEP_08210 [Acidimicrobiales bacterium]